MICLNYGDYSKELHEKVGKQIIKNKIDILIVVGHEAKNISKIAKEKGIETYEYINNSDAIMKIKQIINTDDIILIKASNSMNFKDIVEAIY